MKNKFALFLLVALLVSLAAAANAQIAALKPQANVSSDVVRLGDLIENAGPASAIPVFHAPEFGASGTIQAHRIIDAARANGLHLIDTRGLNEVVVNRAGRTIPVADIERAIAEAAVKQIGRGDAKNFSANFSNAMRPVLIEATASETPRITQFSYDARTQRFSGQIEVADSAILRRTPLRVSGTLVETIEAVTVVRSVERGEILRDSDVSVERRPRAEAGSDVISAQEGVVGQAAKRQLRQGQVLRAPDLMKPDIVARNETVTILFDNGGISLTAKGKALAAGAEGDTISVLNPQSKRVLQGTIDRPGVVIVGRQSSLAVETTGSVR